MKLYRTGYKFNVPTKVFDESNKTLYDDLFIEPANDIKLNYNGIQTIGEFGYTYIGDDIIFNIDYPKEYLIIVLTEIRDDIKIRLRDNKLNTILDETI